MRLRTRTEADDELILELTERELVPVLERAWRFSWDANHGRKFLLDLATGGQCVVAVDEADRPLGYASYLLQEGRRLLLPVRSLWLKYLVVDRNHRGRGIGRRLLEHCEGFARRARCRTVALWVQDGNPALGFYERAGYRLLGREGANLMMSKRVFSG